MTAEKSWPGGARAAVTLSFDDGFAGVLGSTSDVLHARGIYATYHVITGYVGAHFEGLPIAGWNDWRRASSLGHEIASHGMHHLPLAGPAGDLRHLWRGLVSVPNRRRYLGQMWTRFCALRRFSPPANTVRRPASRSTMLELTASRIQIQENLAGELPASFAYPAGRFSPKACRMVQEAGFRSARTNDTGINGGTVNPFALWAVSHGPGMAMDELIDWLDAAISCRGWLILVFHLVAGENPSNYPYYCPLDDFQRLLDAIQVRSLWAATQDAVINRLEQA